MASLNKFFIYGVVVLTLVGCTASQHVKDVRAEDSDRVTVGTVQKEIIIGMSAADVAAVLGSPNIRFWPKADTRGRIPGPEIGHLAFFGTLSVCFRPKADIGLI